MAYEHNRFNISKRQLKVPTMFDHLPRNTEMHRKRWRRLWRSCVNGHKILQGLIERDGRGHDQSVRTFHHSRLAHISIRISHVTPSKNKDLFSSIKNSWLLLRCSFCN